MMGTTRLLARLATSRGTGLAAILIVVSLLPGCPVALADQTTRADGPEGSYAAVINPAGGKYIVSITAISNRADVANSSVQLDVVDAAGTRSFRNPYPGGRIDDSLAIDNRGPCTVRITFRFTMTNGQVQSNTAHPAVITYPARPSANSGPEVSRPTQTSNPGTSTANGERCVTPAGMSGLIDQDPSDSQRPWRRPPGARATINFVVDESITPDWRADLEHGAAAWNRSPCLDTRIVDTCPTGGNCVSVSALDTMADAGDDGNFDAIEKDGFTTGGKITLSNKLNSNQRRNVAVHEMGHAVGLAHRRTNHVMMNADTFDDIFEPDQIDYKNLLFSYDRMQRSP